MTIRELAFDVAKSFGASGPYGRTRTSTKARKLVMAFLRKNGASYTDIGKEFNRTPPAVRYAVLEVLNSPTLAKELEEIEKRYLAKYRNRQNPYQGA